MDDVYERVEDQALGEEGNDGFKPREHVDVAHNTDGVRGCCRRRRHIRGHTSIGRALWNRKKQTRECFRRTHLHFPFPSLSSSNKLEKTTCFFLLSNK